MPATMPATKVFAVAVLALAVAVFLAAEDYYLNALPGRLDHLAAVVEKTITVLELVLKALDLVKKVIDTINAILQWGQAKSLVFLNDVRIEVLGREPGGEEGGGEFLFHGPREFVKLFLLSVN
ncbi:hypothetical protein PISL3812_09989 [Talaromyces islandicus]|uniref:Uncharacterized protein n=1 Tax=Talaromyces islandicus TaxID=28573 RepID=A0A0U1MCR8_TALIS|nr:hypothetical protein PISL3812_09989 [Talaromyces islandicus]